MADKRRCRPAYGLQLPDVGLRSQVPEGTIDFSAMLQRGAKGRVLIFISPGRGRHAPALLYYYTYYSIRAFFKEKALLRFASCIKEIFRLRPPSLSLRRSALKMTGSWFVQGRRMRVLGVLWIGLRRQIGVLP